MAKREPTEHDPLVLELKRAEARRRQITIGMGLVVLIAAIVGVWALVEYREAFFRPQMGVEQGEEDVLARTNDPVCREMIAHVTTTGESFYELEPQIEAGLLADSPATVSETVERLSGLRIRIEEAKASAVDANLRFDESREQLNRWFDFALTELSLLERLATEHRDVLEPPPTPDEPEQDEQGGNEAGTAEKTKGEKTPAVGRTPAQLRDRALLTMHESFQNFRVWHTSGLHPCGEAAEGVEGWTP